MDAIAKIAAEFRDRLGISLDRVVDAIDLLQRLILTGMISSYRNADPGELPHSVDARWLPEKKEMLFRPGILQAADLPEHRFIVAHEVGHLVLRHGLRNRKSGGIAQFGRFVESDERDADFFASALLAAPGFVRLDKRPTAEQLAEEFGLTVKAAAAWLAYLTKQPGARAALAATASRTIVIDTGDYDDAMWAMSFHAEPKNR